MIKQVSLDSLWRDIGANLRLVIHYLTIMARNFQLLIRIMIHIAMAVAQIFAMELFGIITATLLIHLGDMIIIV